MVGSYRYHSEKKYRMNRVFFCTGSAYDTLGITELESDDTSRFISNLKNELCQLSNYASQLISRALPLLSSLFPFGKAIFAMVGVIPLMRS